MSAFTLRQAYDKGYRSSLTNVDWDVALERFSRKFCPPHSPVEMCNIEHAWADGFDDAHDQIKNRRPAADATERVTKTEDD
jgi:hypothetical protein